jgi:hypothetical protein
MPGFNLESARRISRVVRRVEAMHGGTGPRRGKFEGGPQGADGMYAPYAIGPLAIALTPGSRRMIPAGDWENDTVAVAGFTVPAVDGIYWLCLTLEYNDPTALSPVFPSWGYDDGVETEYGAWELFAEEYEGHDLRTMPDEIEDVGGTETAVRHVHRHVKITVVTTGEGEDAVTAISSIEPWRAPGAIELYPWALCDPNEPET